MSTLSFRGTFMGLGGTHSLPLNPQGPRVGSPRKGFSLLAVRVRDPALPGVKSLGFPGCFLLAPSELTWPGSCGHWGPRAGPVFSEESEGLGLRGLQAVLPPYPFPPTSKAAWKGPRPAIAAHPHPLHPQSSVIAQVDPCLLCAACTSATMGPLCSTPGAAGKGIEPWKGLLGLLLPLDGWVPRSPEPSGDSWDRVLPLPAASPSLAEGPACKGY